jgi:hypothetical protein
VYYRPKIQLVRGKRSILGEILQPRCFLTKRDLQDELQITSG